MKWFKVLAVLALFALAVGAAPRVARADEPDYSNRAVVESLMAQVAASSNPSVFYASLSPQAKTAVQNYSKIFRLQTEGVVTDDPEFGTGLCRKRIESTSGYNYLGVTLWTFSLTVRWCWNGNSITRTVSRVRGVTVIWPWEYQGLTDSDQSGGVGQDYYYRYAAGKMCNNLPSVGCVQLYYPYAWIEANSDGTSEGEADY